MIAEIISYLFRNAAEEPVNVKGKIIDYYTAVGRDYECWSKEFNMHFGYYVKGTNPFNREALLQQMNKQVLDRLELTSYKNNRVLDLGCGLGATARYAAGKYPIRQLTGITIVPSQVEQATRLAQQNVLAYNIQFELADFESTDFRNNNFDGIYALDSIRYASGRAKRKLLKEVHRLLKPGAKVVFADGFLKQAESRNPLFNYCYHKMCDCWAIQRFADLQAFKSELHDLGYRDIKIEKVVWPMVPSVLHVPWVAACYLFTRLLRRKNIRNRQRWDHFFGPLLVMLVGLHRSFFGYYFITAKK